MKVSTKNRICKILKYVVLFAVGFVLIYPMIWMFFAAFKSNHEIFSSTKLLPTEWIFDNFVKGWKGTGQYNFTLFFKNSLLLVVPTVIFTVISSVLVGYGFARFKFRGHKVLFFLMISTIMLPNTMTIIPRYIIFNKLGWLNTYMPFYAPALLACNAFFVFQMVQFYRGIPRELDEAACIDGCGTFRTLIYVLVPLCKPAIISMCIFQFMWTWNDFFNSIIFLNDPKTFTVSLGLRMAIDAAQVTNWNQILAMSLVSILPSTIIFFCLQKYFVEGIMAGSIKS